MTSFTMCGGQVTETVKYSVTHSPRVFLAADELTRWACPWLARYTSGSHKVPFLIFAALSQLHMCAYVYSTVTVILVQN